MTKTQYYTATTIDGYIADQRNSLDWLFEADSGGNDAFQPFFAGIGAFAMGRTTYEWVLDHDKMLDHPQKWADYYDGVPAWVFSNRELPAIPGVDLRFVQGDVRAVHEAMVSAAGGRNIWLVGGGDLVGQFADAGLLDEVILGVAPVTLGGGAPVLPRRLTSSRLTLASVEQRNQFVYLTYEVGRPA